MFRTCIGEAVAWLLNAWTAAPNGLSIQILQHGTR